MLTEHDLLSKATAQARELADTLDTLMTMRTRDGHSIGLLWTERRELLELVQAWDRRLQHKEAA